MKIIVRPNTVNGRTESFCRFVTERENVRIKKERGEARPYTSDPILQTYHFCNVRRADDRVTRWIGEWAPSAKNEAAWFWFVVARWFNEPQTLENLTPALENGWDWHKALSILKQMERRGEKIFRASYIINSAFMPGTKKYEAVVKGILNPLAKHPPAIAYHCLEKCHTNLMEYMGMGSFMAGQVVADWETFDVVRGKDVYTWAPLGPGSKRGLQWITGFNKINQEMAVHLMQKLRGHLISDNAGLGRSLTLHDVQNCLCEMAKYVRGYSKTKYEPFDAQGSLL
jgi:5-hmdU DNA kinase-like protein